MEKGRMLSATQRTILALLDSVSGWVLDGLLGTHRDSVLVYCLCEYVTVDFFSRWNAVVILPSI